MGKLNAYVSDLTLRMGPMATNGKLFSVQKSDQKSSKKMFQLLSPEGSKVERVYRNSENGEIYEESSLLKQEVLSQVEKDAGKEAAVVTQEQIEATKAAVEKLPPNVVNVTVHDVTNVEQHLFPSKHSTFAFLPNPKDPVNGQWYDLITAILEQSDKAFISVANIKNHEGLYRLLAWDGHLVLQRQCWPGDLNDLPEPESQGEVDPTVVTKGVNAVNKMTVEFDPESYRNKQGEALNALTDAVKNGNVQMEAPVAKTAQPVDLGSILDSFEDFNE